jgi:hypothetical protein
MTVHKEVGQSPQRHTDVAFGDRICDVEHWLVRAILESVEDRLFGELARNPVQLVQGSTHGCGVGAELLKQGFLSALVHLQVPVTDLGVEPLRCLALPDLADRDRFAPLLDHLGHTARSGAGDEENDLDRIKGGGTQELCQNLRLRDLETLDIDYLEALSVPEQ